MTILLSGCAGTFFLISFVGAKIKQKNTLRMLLQVLLFINYIVVFFVARVLIDNGLLAFLFTLGLLLIISVIATIQSERSLKAPCR